MGRKSWEGMCVWHGVLGGLFLDLLLVSILTGECMRRKVGGRWEVGSQMASECGKGMEMKKYLELQLVWVDDLGERRIMRF